MQRTLAYFTARLYKDFLAYTTERLQELGLNFGQLMFVIYVGKRPGCTPSQLREDLHLDWGYAQRAITRLVQDGFFKKEHTGGRSYHLTLTESGQRAFEVGHEVFQEWDSRQLEPLSAAERETLLSLLERIKKQEH